LGENHIVILDCCSTSNTCCFLAKLCHIEADTRLSLSLVIYYISLVHHNHGTEHLLHSGIIDAALVLLIYDVSFFIQNAEALNLIEIASEIHVVCEFMLKHFSVDLIHGTKRSSYILKKGL
jgi:hypothetical protein